LRHESEGERERGRDRDSELRLWQWPCNSDREMSDIRTRTVPIEAHCWDQANQSLVYRCTKEQRTGTQRQTHLQPSTVKSSTV